MTVPRHVAWRADCAHGPATEHALPITGTLCQAVIGYPAMHSRCAKASALCQWALAGAPGHSSLVFVIRESPMTIDDQVLTVTCRENPPRTPWRSETRRSRTWSDRSSS